MITSYRYCWDINTSGLSVCGMDSNSVNAHTHNTFQRTTSWQVVFLVQSVGSGVSVWYAACSLGLFSPLLFKEGSPGMRIFSQLFQLSQDLQGISFITKRQTYFTETQVFFFFLNISFLVCFLHSEHSLSFVFPTAFFPTVIVIFCTKESSSTEELNYSVL